MPDIPDQVLSGVDASFSINEIELIDTFSKSEMFLDILYLFFLCSTKALASTTITVSSIPE